jgi:DNA primase
MFLEDFIEKSHLNLLQPKSKLALAYLVSRGINLDEIKKYNIGFSPPIYCLPELDAQIANDEDYKNFSKWLGYKGKYIKNRIVIPIYDEFSKVRGLETRSLDKKACNIILDKFKKNLGDEINKLNESDIRYKKFYLQKNKFLATFFGLPDSLPFIWENKQVFITEGIFDLIILKKIQPNCLATLTANISNYQIDWLKRYVEKIYLVFDSDEKGRESSEKIKKIFYPEIQVHNINLKCKDINDYYINYGLKELKYTIDDKLSNIF